MKTYAFVGDSQLGGLRPHLEAFGRVGAVEQRNGAGVAWALTIEGARLRALQSADVVVVFLGGNDGRWTTDAGRRDYQLDARALERRLSAYGASVVWVGPWYSDTTHVAARHDRARAALADAGLGAFVDAYPYTYTLARIDGTHASAEAYRTATPLLARAVERALRPPILTIVGWTTAAIAGLGALWALQKV